MKILGIDVKNDHTDKFLEKVAEAVDLALEECGSECERYAKMKCPVDTGLLRNSVTYAVHGHSPAETSYKADSGGRTGSYSGSAPDGEQCVYVGTNVEYSAYVEMGSSKHKDPKPFLKPALQDHMGKYKSIIQKHIDTIK